MDIDKNICADNETKGYGEVLRIKKSVWFLVRYKMTGWLKMVKEKIFSFDETVLFNKSDVSENSSFGKNRITKEVLNSGTVIFVRKFLCKGVIKIKYFMKKNHKIINCVPYGIGVLVTTGIDFLHYKNQWGKMVKRIKLIKETN